MINRFFPEIHGTFGFGCMRLPMKGGKVDYEEFSRMADAFLETGLNYFDTAHGYIGGQSETAIRFAASFPNMAMVLSSMSNMDQMTDNLSAMKDFKPLDEKELEAFHNWNTGYYYSNIITGGGHGKASDCIRCGKCEKVCPQHLEIRKLLQTVAKTFES